MATPTHISERISFFEQLHQEFLHLKGYGTYAYLTSHDTNQLYDSYLTHQKSLVSSITQQHTEVKFIRSFIKSL